MQTKLQRWLPRNSVSGVRVVLVGWTLASLSLFLDPFMEVTVNPALASSDNWVLVIIGVSISIGGILLLLSRFYWTNSSTSWRLEMAGLPCVFVGWSVYTVAIIINDGLVLFPMLLGASHSVACVVRLVEVLHVTEHTRTNVAQLPPEVLDAA